MKNASLASALLASLLALPVQAATITIDRDVKISGGATAGTFFTQQPGLNNRSLNTRFNDFIVEITDNGKASNGLGFTAGVGAWRPVSIDATTSPSQTSPVFTGLHYGWLDYQSGNTLFELGHLETRVGYESALNYKNAHITHGMLWGVQPAYYPGLRVGNANGNVKWNVDLTNGGPNNQAAVVGGSGKTPQFEWGANYYDEKAGNNIIDVTLRLKVNTLNLGLNINRVWMDADPGAGVDDNALGVAAFTSIKNGSIDIPVRAEMVKDGTSGLYGGVDSAMTFTVSPTKWLDKITYLRGEFAFVNSKNKIFTDADGNAKDSQTSIAVEAGLLF